MTMFHMCMSVRGAIKGNKKDLKGMFNINGRRSTSEESLEILLNELAKGHEVIPLSPCDNFDYSGDGCRGHNEC